MGRVVVVGSCNIDLVCFTERMPKPGETISGSSFMMSHGGKGANQAVMAAKLGSETILLARVGDDSFGNDYMKNLSDSSVCTSHVLKTENVHTGTATIIVDKTEGENCIVIVPGANEFLSVSDIDNNLPPLLSDAKVAVFQMEVSREVTKRSLKLARDAHVVTILNAAPAFPDMDPIFFQLTDILCCNESEAEILTGLAFENEPTVILKIMKTILGFGCRCVVLTLGKHGARFSFSSNPTKVYECFVHDSDVKPVDTTGAGDAFIGTMAHFLAQNLSRNTKLEDCLNVSLVNRAVKVASYTVTRKGAQTSYPTKEELGENFFH